MHAMFAESGMAFADHRVIDRRMSAADAVKLVRAADCIFLMCRICEEVFVGRITMKKATREYLAEIAVKAAQIPFSWIYGRKRIKS